MSLPPKSTIDASRTLLRWGGIASLLMAAVLPVAGWIYLTGDINTNLGVISYSVADLLFGPIFGAAMVTVMAALRQRMGQDAPLRMSLANKAVVLAAGAFVLMACIRAANRHYFLERNQSDLLAWGTLVAGVNGAAWHFLGWAYLLVGWAGWTSRRLPRPLSVVYALAAANALFVYVLPVLEGSAAIFSTIASVWQGILLWKAARA